MFDLGNLSQPKSFRAKRVSTYGYKIQPDGVQLLADITGPGEVAHIWLIADCETEHFLRKFLVRMYWDDEPAPSVDVPLGEFFGVGHAINSPYECATMNVISSHNHPNSPSGHGFVANMYFPMPFKNRPEENYVLLEAKGAGHYVGCNISIHSLSDGWWCEGSEMIYVDGESYPPAIKGIGIEDYVGHGWGMSKQANAYSGCSIYDDNFLPTPGHWHSQWSVYRHHILDPTPFDESIRVTVEHGHSNTRSDDYSSTAYWYQTEPHQAFTLLPVDERLPRPEGTESE